VVTAVSLAAHDDRSSSGPVPADGRWGQLTYTAFDASADTGGEASGGWQVKQTSADLSERERLDLLHSICTEISLVRSLSRFPSRSEVEALPRRLRFRREESGAVWCHSVHAGPDATGRPNNVFNHAVLDRWVGEKSPPSARTRPIEAWRAREWLSPFGATEVQQARLGADPPTSAEVVTRRAVVDFLLDDSSYRFDVFGLLLDAVGQALAGGPPVLLLAPTTDEGAMWLGAVSFFTAPAACLRLSFSTYERLDTVLAELAAGQAPVVSVVPEEDSAQLSATHPPPVVVVDPRVQPRTRTVDEVKHRQTSLGQSVPVSDWSRLALNVCCEQAREVEGCLERLDQICADVSWPADGSPAWPLAAAVTVSPGFPLARESAITTVLRDTPAGVFFTGELREGLREQLTSAVHSAQEAWDRARLASADSGQIESIVLLALETYARHALLDDEWMLSGEQVPLPDFVPSAAPPGRVEAVSPLTEPVRQAFTRLMTSDLPGGGQWRGVLLLRTLDFVVRLQLLVGSLSLPTEQMKQLAADAADLLRGQWGAEIADRTGLLFPLTVSRWIGPALLPTGDREWPAEALGHRLSPALLDLLRPGYTVGRLIKKSQGALEEDPVAVEILVADVLGSGGAVGPGRSAAAALLVRDAAQRRDVVEPAEVTAVLAGAEGDRPWTAMELIDLLARSETLAGPLVVPEILRRVPEWAGDPDAADLAKRLRERIIELTPGWDRAGHPLPRPDGVTQADRNLLHILEATEPRWYLARSGMGSKAVSILGWANQCWPELTPQLRRVLAGRVVVAAFQTALALALDGYSRLGSELRYLVDRDEPGTAWRSALDDLADAAPMVEDLLTGDDDLLLEQLIRAQIRVKLAAVQYRDRDSGPVSLADFPVDRLLEKVLQGAASGRALGLVQAAVDSEMAQHSGSEERIAVLLGYLRGLLGQPDGGGPVPPASEAGDGRRLLGLRRRPKRGQQ
jgi:hypothetical protein